MKRRGVWIAIAVVVVALVVGGVLALQRAREFEALAKGAKAEARAALKSLESGQGAAAVAGFEKSREDFRRAQELLGPDWLRQLPWLGRQLHAADQLTALGVAGATAGSEAAQLLEPAGPVSGKDGLGERLKAARPHLDAALVALVDVARLAGELSPDELVPPLPEAVREATGLLEPMAPVLERSEALLELERYLFAGQHRFLVLAQNNAQLRPTGGFPGTYGLVELGPDGFKLEKFADIYTLPEATLRPRVPDGWRMRSDFLRLRTANWWLDFPTSAELVTELWDRLDPAQPPIDGVIAIDLPTIRNLLEVLGPIRVPESRVALTAENVVEQLGYVVEIEHSGQGYQERKSAVVSLAKGVMQRLVRLTDDEFAPIVKALAESANEKHIQLFLTEPGAQAALVTSGWSGALAPTPETTDLLAVSNAVVGRPAKGNLGVDKTLAYEVDLAPDGSADTRLELGYRKDTHNPLGAHQDAFPNQVRVHRQAGARLIPGKGVTALDDATGLPTYSAAFELPLGRSKVVRMASTLPEAVRRVDGTWLYRLVVAKQADLTDTAADISVTVPQGWRLVRADAVFRASHAALDVVTDSRTARLKTPLEQDLVLDVVVSRG